MDFETFKENLASDVREQFYERFGKEVTVENHKVEKMNETYDALTVKPEDSIIGVNINVNTLYKDYEEGRSYDAIVNGATEVAGNALENRPDFDIDSFSDYDKMKSTLAMEVVSAERNAELLETVPHKDIEDMAVVYRFVIGETSQGSGTILVTNKMLDNYGITPDQLHEDAVKNAPEIRPLVIEGMAEVLAKQMGVEDLEMLGLNIPPEQEQMFVASVEGNVHGAGVLAYRDFMDKAAERVDGECLGLRWEDLDFENKVISINHAVTYYRSAEHGRQLMSISLPKTEAGIRTIPMLDVVKEAFLMEKEQQFDMLGGLNEQIIDGMSGFVFQNADGRVPNPQTVNRKIKRIVETYNSEELLNAAKEKRDPELIPNFSCHVLRHTFATRLCEVESNLKVIQSVMGHRNIETTMDIYAEATEEKKQETFEGLASWTICFRKWVI